MKRHFAAQWHYRFLLRIEAALHDVVIEVLKLLDKGWQEVPEDERLWSWYVPEEALLPVEN